MKKNKENYSIEDVDKIELYKQKRAELMNGDNYLYYEIVIGNGDALVNYEGEKADFEQVLALYNVLKEKIEEMEQSCPEIVLLSKLLESSDNLEIEF